MTYTINLSIADLDAIVAGGTVTTTADGTAFELTDEDHYAGPAFSGGVCRIGLDLDRLHDLRHGVSRHVLASGVNGTVAFTLSAAEVAR